MCQILKAHLADSRGLRCEDVLRNVTHCTLHVPKRLHDLHHPGTYVAGADDAECSLSCSAIHPPQCKASHVRRQKTSTTHKTFGARTHTHTHVTTSRRRHAELANLKMKQSYGKKNWLMAFTLSQPGLYYREILRRLILEITSHHLNYTGMRTFLGDEPTLQPLARRLRHCSKSYFCHNFYHQLLSFQPFTFSVTLLVSEDTHLNLYVVPTLEQLSEPLCHRLTEQTNL
jgi:hypothetical protein